ncbi:DUF6037 family protein [Lactobacillus crispatus]|uniref:DUF6037 family protein n=1 Tax=Lactobacillus crispatus TaxID=47770 RepID=UPI003D6BA4B5
MSGYLSNLALLKEDMVAKDWTIASFSFTYKGIRYVVLIRRFVSPVKRKCQYALVQLEFMHYDNINNNYVVEANKNQLLDDVKSIRKYFGIEYRQNLGDLMKQFSQTLNKAIPTKVPTQYNSIQLDCLNRSLSQSDSQDPNKKYCYGTMLNPTGKLRSPFNSDKIKLYRPILFQKLKSAARLSFCYSDDPKMEKTDGEIIANLNGSLSKPVNEE